MNPDCICGNTEGTNNECERCRFVAESESGKDLLQRAAKEIIALRAELTNALGTPVACSAIAMEIEDRLWSAEYRPSLIDHLKDRITDLACKLMEAKTTILQKEAGQNAEIVFLKNTIRSIVAMADKMSRSGSADRCRAGNDIIDLIDNTAIGVQPQN